MIRTLVRNVASNWAGYCVNAAITFFLTPYILRSLGETRYGVWILASGLIGYYALLDLGFRSGITQYLTRYLATKDIDNMNRTASTGFVTLTLCGLLVLLGTFLTAFNASAILNIPNDMATEATLVILVMGIGIAIQFVFFTYSAVLTALQRFDISNVIGIATKLLSAAATVLCLKLGYGLIGLSLVMTGTNLVDYVLRWQVSARLLPSLKISLRLATKRSLSPFMKFGLWNLAVAGSIRLISYTDALVIAAFLPVSAVAPFAIAATLRSYFEEVFASVGYVFFPAATELDAKGDRSGLQALYLVSSRFMFIGAILAGSVAICWARDFFRLWIGPAYAEPVGYPTVATLFYVLLLGSVVTVGQRIGYQVLQGMLRVPLLATLFALEGVSNLVLSLALVRSYGIMGVALGTLFPALIFQGLLQPYFVCRSLQVSLNTYSRHVLLRPAFLSLALAISLPIFPLLCEPGNWPSLFFWATVSFFLAGTLVVMVGLETSERRSLFVRLRTVFFVTSGDALTRIRAVLPKSVRKNSL